MCSLATVGSVSAQVLTLDTCYARAYKNYPLIKQHDLVDKTREYTLSNASKAYLPQVSITAIEGYVFGGLPSFGAPGSESSNFKFIGVAQVNQTIWDGGATKVQKKIIEASSEADEAALEVSLYDLYSRVNQLYFGILLVDEQLAQLEIRDKILSNNVSRLQQLNDNGLAYKTDVDEIRVEQLKLKQQQAEFMYTRNGYAMMLSLLIGADVDAQAVLQKPTMNDAIEKVPVIRPELTLYKYQRELISAQGGMQKVSMMPKIGILGAGVMLAPGIGADASGTSYIGVAGLSASWSIGGLYKNGNEKHLTEQSLNKVNLQEETFLFNTRMKVTQTYANIEKQREILEQDDEIVALRTRIREGYQLKYDNGAGTLMDLLNATENESDARAQKTLHEMQLLTTIADQKVTTGNVK